MATKEMCRVSRGGRHAADRVLIFEDGVLHDDKRNLSYVALAPPEMVETSTLFGSKTRRVYHVADETGTTFEAPDVQAFIKELARTMGVTVDPNVRLSGWTFEAPDHLVDKASGKRVQVSFRGKATDWDSNVAHAVTRWTILKSLKAKMKASLSQSLPWMILGGALLIIIIALLWTGSHKEATTVVVQQAPTITRTSG